VAPLRRQRLRYQRPNALPRVWQAPHLNLLKFSLLALALGDVGADQGPHLEGCELLGMIGGPLRSIVTCREGGAIARLKACLRLLGRLTCDAVRPPQLPVTPTEQHALELALRTAGYLPSATALPGDA
jgi:hypothetical protein